MVILASVDGKTEPAPTVAVGKNLAERLNEELVVIYVASENDGDADLYPSGSFNTRAEYALHVAKSVTRETIDTTQGVSYRGRVGDPVEEILAEISQEDPAYLIIGGRKRSSVGKAIFGSTTQSLLIESDLPVITIPIEIAQTNWASDGPVIAAVDQSERSKIVLSEAEYLAKRLDENLHIVHVISEDTHQLSDKESVQGTGWDLPESQIEEEALEIASNISKSHVDDAIYAGLAGAPSKRILEYASAKNASYIVTSGRKRSPVGKVLFGSVTQSILLQSDRPVLTVMN